MSDCYVTVAEFPDSFRANVARNLLARSGIRALLLNEATVDMAWHLAGAVGGVKLQVDAQHADRARQLLADPSGAAPESPAAPEEPATSEVGGAPRTAEDEDAEPILSDRDRNADRAFRGAVLGLLFPPIELYVFWLLLKVFGGGGRRAGSGGFNPVQREPAPPRAQRMVRHQDASRPPLRERAGLVTIWLVTCPCRRPDWRGLGSRGSHDDGGRTIHANATRKAMPGSSVFL